jgi:molecular chaperone GrpE
VAAAFLPVLDNIDLALRHADADPSAIVDGIRAIRDQAQAALTHLGYPRQDETGAPFDPARHEVVAVVAPEGGLAPGVVVEVLRPGYGEPERQLRPAAVTVSGDPAG